MNQWIPIVKGQSDWIVTYSGRQFHPLDPHPSEIELMDIAQGLAKECRSAGQIREFFSVAEHSILVSHYVPPHLALVGLLHDASEAYLKDIPRPIKHALAMSGYREIEASLDRAIAYRFGLPYPWPREVKEVDRRVLQTERRDLLSPQAWRLVSKDVQPYPDRIKPLGPKRAARAFLRRYREIVKAHPLGSGGLALSHEATVSFIQARCHRCTKVMQHDWHPPADLLVPFVAWCRCKGVKSK